MRRFRGSSFGLVGFSAYLHHGTLDGLGFRVSLSLQSLSFVLEGKIAACTDWADNCTVFQCSLLWTCILHDANYHQGQASSLLHAGSIQHLLPSPFFPHLSLSLPPCLYVCACVFACICVRECNLDGSRCTGVGAIHEQCAGCICKMNEVTCDTRMMHLHAA